MTLPDPTARDIRDTEDFAGTLRYFETVHAPAFGQVSNAVNPSAAPGGGAIAFAGEVLRALEGVPRTHLCLADEEGVVRLTEGEAEEKHPRFAPDGQTIAFSSDRARPGAQQLELLDVDSGQVRAAPIIDGTVEYLHWSPSGDLILLGVAGLEADRSGGEGSGRAARVAAETDAGWLPEVDAGVGTDGWRSAWVYDVAKDSVRQVSPDGLNIWEAAWCGPGAIVVVAGPTPDEGAWYTADLLRLDLATGGVTPVYSSNRQLGLPAATPSGDRTAVIQACCSDRWVVAGDVVLVDGAEMPRVIDSGGVDVTCLQWLDDSRLAFIGLRGLLTVAGVFDVQTNLTSETWSGASTCGDRYPMASFLADGSAAVVHHAYDVYPELAWVRDGGLKTLATLRHAGADHLAKTSGSVTAVSWAAPDGKEIEGLLCLPEDPGPSPLVVFVHGGPVWAYRNRWAMGHLLVPLLASRGYAVLHPNPRGSAGRGQEFAEAVFGDMGGLDTHDYLSGIDHLVAQGVADAGRIGVMGGSYGGFISAWLITQDQRFAAAVPMAPVTNWYSQHHTSNISYFDEIFLAADPHAPGGRYHERSPVMFADRVRTPTLLTAGLDDRCTPPTQATEFHRALLAAGVTSICVSYPDEGHGIRGFPAAIDQCTRVVDWFERHMPARVATTEGS